MAIALCCACGTKPAAPVDVAPPPPPSPVARTFDDLETAEHNALVTIDGYFSAPSSMFTYGSSEGPRSWKLNFTKRPGGRDSVEISVTEGDGPNTMAPLANPYDPADLRLHTAGGATVGPEDKVRVTAKVWRVPDKTEGLRKNSLSLESIELLPKEPEPEPVVVAFDD